MLDDRLEISMSLEHILHVLRNHINENLSKLLSMCSWRRDGIHPANYDWKGSVLVVVFNKLGEMRLCEAFEVVVLNEVGDGINI